MDRNKRALIKNKEKSPFSKPIRLGLILLIIFAVYEISFHFVEPKLLPIKHIKMAAHHELINLTSLKTRMAQEVKGFFSTDVMALKNKMLAEPFVDQVIIKRVWPDTLFINLTEVTLVANWGQDIFVTSKGDLIFAKTASKKQLPIFKGPTEYAGKILAEFNALSALFQPYNLVISEVELNMRHSWQVTLDNGMKLLLGRKDIPEHISSFLAIYPKIKKRYNNEIISIDLRHSNGISVHTQNQEQE